MTTVAERPALEVADVIRESGSEFAAKYGRILTPAQTKALRDLSRCRTAALGGHVDRCLDCGHERIAYNSCRNRHCPKCQALTRAQWLAAQAEHLLPVEYYHLVFTLPAELSDLARANPTVLYDLLFQAAAGAIRDVAANPKRLGAMPGLLLVLHTWGQTLHHHPHVHGVVTGGGLSCNSHGVVDGSPRWVACRPGFFLPVRVLSRVFRGKYLDGLRQAYARGELRFFGKLRDVARAAAFQAFLRPLSSKDWVVFAKRPIGGPAQVLKYLARYTHRVAISNSRLVKLDEGRVSFRYKDYADDHQSKVMTLAAVEFLRRFVQHVLPGGFVKVRSYGLMANRFRAERLTIARRLLWAAAVLAVPGGVEAASESLDVEPVRERCCAKCGSRRLACVALPREGVSNTS
jgi:putative transposase/transposase-like zinc-binding protein